MTKYIRNAKMQGAALWKFTEMVEMNLYVK